MDCKTFEIRDRETFIPVLAVKLKPVTIGDRFLFDRAGYGQIPSQQGRYILLSMLDGGKGCSTSDPYQWGGGARTMTEAHKYIIKHFDEMESGEVVDVQFIFGETTEKKKSEILD